MAVRAGFSISSPWIALRSHEIVNQRIASGGRDIAVSTLLGLRLGNEEYPIGGVLTWEMKIRNALTRVETSSSSSGPQNRRISSSTGRPGSRMKNRAPSTVTIRTSNPVRIANQIWTGVEALGLPLMDAMRLTLP